MWRSKDKLRSALSFYLDMGLRDGTQVIRIVPQAVGYTNKDKSYKSYGLYLENYRT